MGSRSRWVIDKTEVVSRDGMVCAMQPAAAEAGAEMLRRGGTAVDAALAAAFASGVVEPFMSGVGGMAWMVCRVASTGEQVVLDGATNLPSAIRPELFEVLPGDRRVGTYAWRATRDDSANTGWLAPAVPGMVALAGEAHRRLGRLPWPELLEPAVELAETGFEVSHYVATVLAANWERLGRFDESRRVFLKPSGAPLSPSLGLGAGDRLVQHDLAWTLRRIAAEGPETVYRGEVARRICAAMERFGGLVSRDELAAYRALERAAVATPYRGVEVVGQLENTGYATVVEALRILEGFDLRRIGFQSPDAVHLQVEAVRRAFVDRLRHLGDASFGPVPWRGVISEGFAAERRATIDPSRATPGAGAGDPWRHDPGRPAAGVPPRRAPSPGGGDDQTTHITVVDRDRNIVALTATLGGTFGSAVTVPGTGIVLNNATMWFDPEPGSVNSIAPGRRIMAAVAPVLVLRSGQPLLAIGSPGGRRVISAVTQSIINVVDHGLGVQAAVTAPRFHCEGRETSVSHRFPEEVLSELGRRGHELAVRDDALGTSWFGRPNGILLDARAGELHGGVYHLTPAEAIGV